MRTPRGRRGTCRILARSIELPEKCTRFDRVSRRSDGLLTISAPRLHLNGGGARYNACESRPKCDGHFVPTSQPGVQFTAPGLALCSGMTFSLSSPAFKEGPTIPGKYTCDGADVSPPLGWSGAPPGTVTLALIADDPDAPAGTWVHWVLYNLPGTVSHLPENVPKTETLPDLGGALQGRTDFRRPGYGGPGPPPPPAHRDFF